VTIATLLKHTVDSAENNRACTFRGSSIVMLQTIIDFSTFVEEKHEYQLKGHVKKKQKTVFELPMNYNFFFKKRGHCPSCSTEAKVVFDDDRSFTLGKDFFATLKVWECENCGWWEIYEDFLEEHDLIDEVDKIQIENLKHAIVKSFKVNDKALPIQALLRELELKKDLLYKIHHYKMEELVQHVFSSFYECVVKHVGQTGDGGKDLIMVLSDEPILIQVKRRTYSDAVEEVSTVRDFLGTMFIENSRKGIIVSTADHFSRGSITVTEQLLNKNKLEKFELVDFHRFCEMLDVIKKNTGKPWENKVEKWLEYKR
jgi:restriction system protein